MGSNENIEVYLKDLKKEMPRIRKEIKIYEQRLADGKLTKDPTLALNSIIRLTLLVIAGCNGSGKSSFSSALTKGNIIPFDYDKHYLNFYRSIIDNELRDTMAHKYGQRFPSQIH